MKLADALLKAGYAGEPAEFERVLADVFAEHFSTFSDEDLLCRPKAALKYCRLVREAAGCRKIAEYAILRGLTNMRKRSRLAGKRARAAGERGGGGDGERPLKAGN